MLYTYQQINLYNSLEGRGKVTFNKEPLMKPRELVDMMKKNLPKVGEEIMRTGMKERTVKNAHKIKKNAGYYDVILVRDAHLVWIPELDGDDYKEVHKFSHLGVQIWFPH